MTFSKPLSEREKALEDAFFQKENERLIEALRAKKAESEQRAALSGVLAFANEGVVSSLLGLGVRAESVAALVIAPLVAIAWADRHLDDDERKQVIAAERHYGIDPKSDAGRLLATWLEARPHDSLIDVWSSYVRELAKVLPPGELAQLRAEVVGRSQGIAQALEKSLFHGRGPGRPEADVLAKIEAAFASA